jgi:hypothetical protein
MMNRAEQNWPDGDVIEIELENAQYDGHLIDRLFATVDRTVCGWPESNVTRR